MSYQNKNLIIGKQIQEDILASSKLEHESMVKIPQTNIQTLAYPEQLLGKRQKTSPIKDLEDSLTTEQDRIGRQREQKSKRGSQKEKEISPCEAFDSEDSSKERRLQQNRKSAMKCRLKKKAEVDKLYDKMKELKDQNITLKCQFEQVSYLFQEKIIENTQLKEKLDSLQQQQIVMLAYLMSLNQPQAQNSLSTSSLSQIQASMNQESLQNQKTFGRHLPFENNEMLQQTLNGLVNQSHAQNSSQVKNMLASFTSVVTSNIDKEMSTPNFRSDQFPNQGPAQPVQDLTKGGSVNEMTLKLLSIAGINNHEHTKSKTNDSSSDQESQQSFGLCDNKLVSTLGQQIKQNSTQSPVKIQIFKPRPQPQVVAPQGKIDLQQLLMLAQLKGSKI